MGRPPVVTCTTQQQLDKNIQLVSFVDSKSNASVKLSFNKMYRLGLGWVRSNPQLDFSVSPIKLSSFRSLRCHMAWRPRSGTSMEATLSQSQNTRLGSFALGVRHHSRTGLSWIIQIVRGDLTIRVPILLGKTGSSIVTSLQSIYLSIISVWIQEALADLWKLSENNIETKRSLERQRRALQTTKLRSDAEQQQRLMQNQAKKRHKEEKDKQGLVILKGVYHSNGGNQQWDVTIPLQFWIHKSSLELNSSTKRNMLGFYDITIGAGSGEAKKQVEKKWYDIFISDQGNGDTPSSSSTPTAYLSIRYEFAGSTYEISVRDDKPVSLPTSKAKLLTN